MELAYGRLQKAVDHGWIKKTARNVGIFLDTGNHLKAETLL